MKSIAIIPARSGSKGLADKNITDLCGHPLMYYTIEAARDSNCFNTVMVSTDSSRYADVALNCGAEVPFLRSEKTASDTAGSWDVVREVLQKYKELGSNFDYVALLQPTSPLRDSDDIKNVWDKLKKTNANNAVTVTQVDHPVQWCFRLPKNDLMTEMASSPYGNMRRQELEKYYRENGAMYLVDAEKILDSTYNFYADRCIAYVMQRDKSIDIDTKIDLIIAEAEMKMMLGSKSSNLKYSNMGTIK